VGINAASKSALLGETDLARQLAAQVKALTSRFIDASDFYKTLTLAEALVLLGDHTTAARLYRECRVRYPDRSGDLVTTREQLEGLIMALPVPEEGASALREALGA
jgi:hypothetical protein